MNALQIGTSAIAAGQRGLDLVGQNLANAATPGYHRQAVNLVSRVTGDVYGTGVAVASITRFTAQAVRTAILSNNSAQAAFSTRLDIRRQIERALGTTDGGIADQLNDFFNRIEQLSSRPDDTAARRPLIATAVELARQFNAAATDIDRLRNTISDQIPQAVEQLNDWASRIADLNIRISIREKTGDQANDLRDQRDQLIHDLAKLVDIKTVDQPYGVVNVMAAGAAIVVGEFANRFEVNTDPQGNWIITPVGSTQSVTFQSGRLGALLQEHNTEIPATRSRLDALVSALVNQVNAVHATGVPLSGPWTTTTGTVSALSATVPLDAAGLPFPIQTGHLTISVTDTSTNIRTSTTIPIDPATQSLNDLATALSSIPGLTASVHTPANTLQVDALPGFAFDFAAANADTAGLLPALGINGFFLGSTAAGIRVRSEIVANPNLLAAGTTPQPGDSTNLQRWAALRDVAVFGNRTFQGEYADQAAAVGADVQSLADRQTAQTNLMQALSAQEQAVIGVDMNEELVRLLDFQRMVQSASRYLSVVNSALDEIIDILR
ncbi:MAG: flagellar hook-associated protein FlgK [Gemmataceae bacterium]|nr:flagellar hook-associated protein FlgK [Gemmata sp.]MDW8197058.1 flagellar hook-associated protein FlgK [Gemmataceae bacterium]